jgi:hypothetical protein
MTIKADRDTVIATLKKNRERHKQIVSEARVGYVKKAREALMEKLALVESGKVVALTFALEAPQDHTKVYDTAIEMLSMHTDATIILDAGQVRNLVMDEWDWTSHFMLVNSAYSNTAAATRYAADDE